MVGMGNIYLGTLLALMKDKKWKTFLYSYYIKCADTRT